MKKETILRTLIAVVMYTLAMMLLRETFLREIIAIVLVVIGVYIQNEK